MKTLIIYHSKTGFTKKYAQWLREDLGCDCLTYDERAQADYTKYDAVAFGGGIYVGKISKLNWFKKQLPELRGKRVALFYTGAMPPEPADIRRIERENLAPEEQSQMKCFYLQGGLNYTAMGPVDRMLMAMFKKMLKSKADSPKEKIMLQNVQQSYDKTSREALGPLEEYLTGGKAPNKSAAQR